MNKESICILGGAGYVGILLTNLLSKLSGSKIYVVTQNTTKSIFFRKENVKVLRNVDEIVGENLKVINLAYSVSDSFIETQRMNYGIFCQITNLIMNNNVSKLIHVSSIVLSNEGSPVVSKIRREDTYYYAKSLMEVLISKKIKKYDVPIVIIRSGNIIGEGSPWVSKIIERLICGKPLTGSSILYPSQTTYVGNLVYAISQLLHFRQNEKLMLLNFCEFGKVNWYQIISEINEGFNYPILKWNHNYLEELNPSLKEDLRNIIRKIQKVFILGLYKGRRTNRVVVNLIDFLRIRNLKTKSKTKLNTIRNSENVYIDLAEYNVLRVFMNYKSNSTENCPLEIINNLPFSYSDSIKRINGWITSSGYSLFKSNV